MQEKEVIKKEQEIDYSKQMTKWLWWIPVFAFVAVVAIHGLVVLGSLAFPIFPSFTGDYAAKLGDSFGTVNAIVSACALVAIVISIRQQQEAIRLQRLDLKDTQAIFNAQMKEQQKLNNVSAFAAHQQAIEFLEECEDKLNKTANNITSVPRNLTFHEARTYLSRVNHVNSVIKNMAIIADNSSVSVNVVPLVRYREISILMMSYVDSVWDYCSCIPNEIVECVSGQKNVELEDDYIEYKVTELESTLLGINSLVTLIVHDIPTEVRSEFTSQKKFIDEKIEKCKAMGVCMYGKHDEKMLTDLCHELNIMHRIYVEVFDAYSDLEEVIS